MILGGTYFMKFWRCERVARDFATKRSDPVDPLPLFPVFTAGYRGRPRAGLPVNRNSKPRSTMGVGTWPKLPWALKCLGRYPPPPEGCSITA